MTDVVREVRTNARPPVVEPGAIATDFAGRSFDFTNDESIEEYQGTAQGVMGSFGAILAEASPASVVAEVIWTAVTDGTDMLRYTAGADAEPLLANRAAVDDATYMAGIKSQFGMIQK